MSRWSAGLIRNSLIRNGLIHVGGSMLCASLIFFAQVSWAEDATGTEDVAGTVETETATGTINVDISVDGQHQWPSFRGPQASGVAAGSAPRIWDMESGLNVLWKAPVPGLGHSSPVIWDDHVFITTAVARDSQEIKVGQYGSGWSADDNGEQRWQILAFDRESGHLLWQRTAHQGTPKIRRHPKATHANSTPATDGKRVAAFFGSEGLYVYDMDGQELWRKDLGVLHSGSYMMPPAQWGFGSSPILHDDKVIVQCDILKNSFLAVFDADDGHEIWRSPRDEFPTWSTPTVIRRDGIEQVVVNGFKHMGAYDLADGKELWHLTGGGDIPVPTPIYAHGLIYLTNAHGAQSPVYAIRPDGSGDISLEGDATSNQHIAWSVPRGGAYMPTPLVYGDELYVCRDKGILRCFDAKTGVEHYKERIDTNAGFTASAVAADGYLYYPSETGEIHIVKAGPSFEKPTVVDMGETVLSSPAIAFDTLFVRTRNHLVALRQGAGLETEVPDEEATEVGAGD